MSNFLWKKEKKVNKKKSYADRPYLIFLAMLVETKNIFYALVYNVLQLRTFWFISIIRRITFTHKAQLWEAMKYKYVH